MPEEISVRHMHFWLTKHFVLSILYFYICILYIVSLWYSGKRTISTVYVKLMLSFKASKIIRLRTTMTEYRHFLIWLKVGSVCQHLWLFKRQAVRVEDEIRTSAVINQISSTPVTLRQICSYTSERLMHFMFISTHFSRRRHSTARPPVRPRAVHLLPHHQPNRPTDVEF